MACGHIPLCALIINHQRRVSQYLTSLRKDLEKVRTLTELTRKREQQKLSQAQLLHDAISKVLFPHEPAIKLAFEQIHLCVLSTIA